MRNIEILKTAVKAAYTLAITAAVALPFSSCKKDNVKSATHEAVDLGLSVKWATCNVGASKPEDCGDYFAWGETSSKEDYVWSTYRLGNYPYITQKKYTADDKLTTLEPVDDAASVNWGGTWRTPTAEEWEELILKCNWEFDEEKKGYTITSITNNKSIFLPDTGGHRDGTELTGVESQYWSSSIYKSDTDYAGCLLFNSTEHIVLASLRILGLPVRPVTK